MKVLSLVSCLLFSYNSYGETVDCYFSKREGSRKIFENSLKINLEGLPIRSSRTVIDYGNSILGDIEKLNEYSLHYRLSIDNGDTVHASSLGVPQLSSANLILVVNDFTYELSCT
jgi:hypothetical protein